MSEKKTNSTPKKRIIEFNKKYLFEKNNELWCRACNVKIVHEKKSSVKQHLETITHLNLTNIINSNKKNQFKPSDRHDIKKEFGKDLMIAFASANIPVYKLENKIFKKTLSKYLVDEVATAWPSTSLVRKTLPNIHKTEFEQLKISVIGKKIAIFADETTDTEQRYVLNILILELDFIKECKPLLAETFFLEVNNNN
jgi:hypothetical protein